MTDDVLGLVAAAGGGGTTLGIVAQRLYAKWREDRQKDRQELTADAQLTAVATKLEAVSIKLAEVAERLAGATATAAGLEQRINGGLKDHGDRLRVLEQDIIRVKIHQESLFEEVSKKDPA